jgi:hypothetical protein
VLDDYDQIFSQNKAHPDVQTLMIMACRQEAAIYAGSGHWQEASQSL